MTAPNRNEFLYLCQADVESAGVTMPEIIETVEGTFRELGMGRVELPPKTPIHPGPSADSFTHAMPASIPNFGAAGMKWISAYPGNKARGLPNISGLLILNDVATGLPMTVMDCTWVTGMRTGAASAVSAKYLSRADASTIGILGCGVQGHAHLEAMSCLFPLDRLCAYDHHRDRAQHLVELAERLGFRGEVAATPKDAVTGCDIVVTAGPIVKRPHATIEQGWLDAGSFASLVDFDSYFSREALAEADMWTTDHLEQYRYYRDEEGYFQGCPEVSAELGELVTGSKPGRETADERTFAANLGIAALDVAVGALVYSRACAKGIGTRLPV